MTNPDEIVEAIEAAEEAKEVAKIVEYVELASSHGGDEDWAEASEAALDALYRLVKGGSAQPSLSYLKSVLKTLTSWKEEEAIVEVGLGCVVAIASKAKEDTDNPEDAAAVDVGLVVQLMKDFADEATIQEQACLAMEGLAIWKASWKTALASQEGIQEELGQARDSRITNERNKSYPVRAAKALGMEL